MDVWVVKYASRRSRIGDFLGRCILGASSRQRPCAWLSSSEAPGSRAFWALTRVQAKGGCRLPGRQHEIVPGL
jgi:hypothetical protein